MIDGVKNRKRTEALEMRTLDDVEKGIPTSSTPVPFEKPREFSKFLIRLCSTTQSKT